MNDKFPSNSHNPASKPRDSGPELPSPEEKNLEKVVSNSVIRRKKPLGRRFLDTFFSGDGGVITYLAKEVLLPNLQNLLIDFVTQGVEKAVYGEVRSPRHTYNRSSPTNRTHISYNRQHVSRAPEPRATTQLRRPASQPSAMDLGEIILETMMDAEIIRDRLLETLQDYGAVTVADLNVLLGQTSVYTDHRWGWTDLSLMHVKRIREGFLLVLPEPESLK